MKALLTKIGNSRGIRIPKPIIEECALTSEVNLEVKGQTLVISPISHLRDGWEEKFKEMNEKSEDALVLSDMENNWDEEEWEWK